MLDSTYTRLACLVRLYADVLFQPFLPPVPPASGSPIAAFVLNMSSCIHSLSRAILLAVVALAYLLLVEGVCLVLVSSFTTFQ